MTPIAKAIRMGIDVGSTTVKVVALDEHDQMLFSKYQRHKSDVRMTMRELVSQCLDALPHGSQVAPAITGSGGLQVSRVLDIPFVQEVIASTSAVKRFIPEADVVIELGGEDAKITYCGSALEQRMNGTCAGGTGAFIDQMASLLETDADGLNRLSEGAKTIYPIAARCGVFAKTDIQPLINEGARREDIAMSIYQAVVSQTVGGLACGRPIRGKVAFLGGPLHFMPQLRERFVATLKLGPQERIVPDHAELFVAIGAALNASRLLRVSELRETVDGLVDKTTTEIRRLDPLFSGPDDLASFRARHGKATARRGDLASCSGPLFLGLDAGSTTTKAVLINDKGEIVYDRYEPNGGDPVKVGRAILLDIYERLPAKAFIGRACSTGYGEQLFQSAFGVDMGEVETICHYRAADFFLPGVQFLLDIGGQDMKCLQIRDGAIDRVLLNEACSSGCGSFLDNFARSLQMSIRDFSERALLAGCPVDLGSRCTVFMNSRVKQAQKEGCTVGDIAAGLSYSVIKNALIKVCRIRDPKEVGDKVVVQGGTFANEAVLRAFELISGHEVVRPDVAGLMGAYGAALIAHEGYSEGKSKISTKEQVLALSQTMSSRRCGGCSNNCLLTVSTFSHGGRFITGNRCERALGLDGTAKGGARKVSLPNVVAQKYARLFRYRSRKAEDAPRGSVGIPRVLSMYEHYPFWHTFFSKLGFRVVLSPRSNREMYERGLGTIASESVCFPAKIGHGHIEALLEKGVPFIWYPCVPFELKEDPTAVGKFNCPIVAAYPEVLKNNVDMKVRFCDPFLPMDDPVRLSERLVEEFGAGSWPDPIPAGEVRRACSEAWAELEAYRRDIRRFGEEALAQMTKHGMQGIVLGSRPYHADPEVNHGIPELITGLGLAVLTEDSVAHLGTVPRPLRAVDWWSFHNRLYRAAAFVCDRPDLEFVQLNSFGCGIDAITADQAEELLRAKGRLFTLLKIDEGTNLGAVRIRLRSLLAAARRREKAGCGCALPGYSWQPALFTPERRAARTTILAPQMSPIHFSLVQAVCDTVDYDVRILPSMDKAAIDIGMKYVNNDACYPSIVTAGQMLSALRECDPDKTALVITQTCGGCRATNYVGFLRKAVADAGMPQVPVIGVSMHGLESHKGFRLGPLVVHQLIRSVVLGDALMRCLYRTRPYELIPGSADALHRRLEKKCIEHLHERWGLWTFNPLIREIVEEFDRLPLKPGGGKPRIGVVGEILVKFHPLANNDIVAAIEAEGCEAVVPDLMDFFLYCARDQVFTHQKLSGSRLNSLFARSLIWFTERYRMGLRSALRRSHRFGHLKTIEEMADLAVEAGVQLGNMTGEGWLLTAEMAELLHSGVNSIACLQPFACLPNHIVGKGMIKELRRKFPGSNVAAIDYDPGASEVNQLNRLKLLIANAKPSPHPDAVGVGAS